MSSLKGKPFKLCYKTENKTKHSLILVLFSITKEKKEKKKNTSVFQYWVMFTSLVSKILKISKWNANSNSIPNTVRLSINTVV